jgi:dTDP-glucose pyrophosphorylase
MHDIKKLKIRKEYTLKSAMEVIESGASRIALVVDDNDKLIGTLTDGDVRRGLLKGMSIYENVAHAMNPAPKYCSINDDKEHLIAFASKNNIQQIIIVDDDMHIVSFTELTELLKAKELDNTAVIMAGGMGTRLRPLTTNIPKPMLKVGGKPILETIIGNFQKHGIVNIVLTVNYMKEKIIDYFQDGSLWGVNISYVEEEKRMGTAGSLSMLKGKLDQPFFVANGDLLTTLNFSNVLSFHETNGCDMTVCVKKYNVMVPYGIVQDDEQHNITGIVEKPIYDYYINSGIYMLSPETLSFIPDDSFYDMPELIDSMIANQKTVKSFRFDGYWTDIGHIDSYTEANIDYSKEF